MMNVRLCIRCGVFWCKSLCFLSVFMMSGMLFCCRYLMLLCMSLVLWFEVFLLKFECLSSVIWCFFEVVLIVVLIFVVLLLMIRRLKLCLGLFVFCRWLIMNFFFIVVIIFVLDFCLNGNFWLCVGCIMGWWWMRES